MVELDVGEVEVDGLLAAEPGGVDELHERAIPDGERVVAGVEPRELGVDLLWLRRDR